MTVPAAPAAVAVLAAACALTAVRGYVCGRQVSAMARNTLGQPFERAVAWLRRHACPDVLTVVRRGACDAVALGVGEMALVVDGAGIVRDVVTPPLDGGTREVAHGGVVMVSVRPCADSPG